MTAPATQPMFAEGIVGFAEPPGNGPYLIGGHCPVCQRCFFPQQERCRHCGGGLHRLGLGCAGTIYSQTVVRTKPPLGLPRPYALAYVDLDEHPLRILMPLDPNAVQPLSIGDRVELAVDTLGVNQRGEPCRRPFFRARTPPSR